MTFVYCESGTHDGTRLKYSGNSSHIGRIGHQYLQKWGIGSMKTIEMDAFDQEDCSNVL